MNNISPPVVRCLSADRIRFRQSDLPFPAPVRIALSALLALAFWAAPPLAPEAGAQTEVWSATVTVAASDGYGYIAPDHPSTIVQGEISDDNFTFEGTEYTVWRVTLDSTSDEPVFGIATGSPLANTELLSANLSELSLEITANATHMDGADVATVQFSDATFNNTTQYGYTWSASLDSIDPDVHSGTFTVKLLTTADITAMVTSIERQHPSTSPTNADSLKWRVTFSEDVKDIDTGDFTVTGTTATITAVTAVTGSMSQYDVTVSGGDLDNLNGTVTLSFASDQDIKSLSDNLLSSTAPTGANENSYEVVNTGMISETDPIPQAWIGRFGRTVAEQVLEQIGSRLQASRASVAEYNLAGITQQQSVTGHSADGSFMHQTRTDGEFGRIPDAGAINASHSGIERIGEDFYVFRSRELTALDLLTDSSFSYTLASEGGAGKAVSVWGRADVSNFDGQEGALRLDGEVVTGSLGADRTRSRWMEGFILSVSQGEGSWSGAGAGEIEASLTSLFPWVRYALTDRLDAWVAAGYGSGSLTMLPGGRQAGGEGIETDLSLRMVSMGLHGTMLDGGSDGLTLTGKSDALMVRTESDSVANARGRLKAASATVTRFRLGLEGTRPFLLDGGSALTPNFEFGFRRDSGDAERGIGMDFGAGLTWINPALGLRLEISGRGLLDHSERDFRDEGYAASIDWDQNPGTGRGAKLSLARSVGGAASGGTEALFSGTVMQGFSGDPIDGAKEAHDSGTGRLEAAIGYGYPILGGRYTLTPGLSAGLSGSARDYRQAWRLVRSGSGSSSAELVLEMVRRESGPEDNRPEHGVGISFRARF